MAYRFKYYYKDGTIEKSNCRGNTSESLYNDFDGLMEVLEMAMKVYKGFLKDFIKLKLLMMKLMK